MHSSQQPIGTQVSRSGAARPTRTDHQGRWVRLEALSPRHVDALFATTHEPHAGPELWTYLPYGPFASSEELADWVAGAPDDDPVFFALCDPVSGQARGVASFLRIDPLHGVIEIGHIWLSPLIQRTRAATEAIFLLLRHAFDDLGYRRLEWKCDALNQPSCRAAERYGFTFEGIFRQAAVIKGHNRDTAWFSIIDTDWPPISSALRRWLGDENFNERGEQHRRLGEIRQHPAGNEARTHEHPSAAGDPIRGSCLCGRVRFELTPPFRRANHCHCSRCRKHSGGAGLAQGRVGRERFRLLQGAEAIVTYRPDGGMVKAFCGHCGSSLFGGTWPEGPEVSVRLGALDDDPGLRPQYHSFVGSKAPWEVLPEDGLPRFEGRVERLSRPIPVPPSSSRDGRG